MNLDRLEEFEGHEVVLRFIDGHIVRARLIHVDRSDRRDFIYDVLEVLAVGPVTYAEVRAGITAVGAFKELDRFDAVIGGGNK